MQYIRQKADKDSVLTVVVAEGDLTKHPAIIDHPELFEIVEGEIPKDTQFLNYVSDIEP